MFFSFSFCTSGVSTAPNIDIIVKRKGGIEFGTGVPLATTSGIVLKFCGKESEDLELKYGAHDLQTKTNKKFSLLTQGRKWNFECINHSDKDAPINSVKCVKNVANGKYENSNNDDDNIGDRGSLLLHVGGGKGGDLEKNESTKLNSNRSSNTNSVASKAARKKTIEWIDKLLSNTIDRFERLLKENNETHINIDSDETNESIYSVLKWYEYIKNTRTAFEILLAKPFVARARSKLLELMQLSQNVLLDDIKSFVVCINNSNYSHGHGHKSDVNDAIIIHSNQACNVMSDLPKVK